MTEAQMQRDDSTANGGYMNELQPVLVIFASWTVR